MATINGVRIFLYVVLWLFAVVLLGLTAHRLRYTMHLPRGDPLNGGHSFYDPVIAELLASSILTVIWVPFVIYVLSGTSDYGFYGSFLGETFGLFCLFVLWLVGAGISTHFWGDLAWCHQFIQCRILTVLVAFAWMGWIALFTLLLINLIFSITNKSFNKPLHARYDPRGSQYVPNSKA